jgi:hypothetical protein
VTLQPALAQPTLGMSATDIGVAVTFRRSIHGTQIAAGRWRRLIVTHPFHVVRPLVEGPQLATCSRIGPDQDDDDHQHNRNHHEQHCPRLTRKLTESLDIAVASVQDA